MEGEGNRPSRAHAVHIGLHHTTGNPGRNDLHHLQEPNYSAIMQAIAATGYQGYVGQEFVPLGDPLAALAEAFQVCDVRV